MERNINSRTIALMLLICSAYAATVSAAYDLSWYTFDGGGTAAAAGGSFSLAGTIGQPDAGTMNGGSFTLTGGFWAVTTNATPPPSCEGDANGDGVVDPLDSGYVLSRFGCDVGGGDADCDAADVNGSGAVDPLDAGYVLARFGDCE